MHNQLQLQLQGTNALSDILIHQAVCCVRKCIRKPLIHKQFILKSVRSVDLDHERTPHKQKKKSGPALKMGGHAGKG